MAVYNCPECRHIVNSHSDKCCRCVCNMNCICARDEECEYDENRGAKIIIRTIAILLILTGIMFWKYGPRKLDFGVTSGDNSVMINTSVVQDEEKIKWGCSLAELENTYTNGNEYDSNKNDNKISYDIQEDNFIGINGVTSFTSYNFVEDKLVSIDCILGASKDSNMSDEDVVNRVKDVLNSKYGKYTKSDSSTYGWSSEDADISMLVYKPVISLTYTYLDVGK